GAARRRREGPRRVGPPARPHLARRGDAEPPGAPPPLEGPQDGLRADPLPARTLVQSRARGRGAEDELPDRARPLSRRRGRVPRTRALSQCEQQPLGLQGPRPREAPRRRPARAEPAAGPPLAAPPAGPPAP